MTAEAQTTSDAHPHPPRYRWLKRLSLALGIFLGVFVVAYFAWRFEVRRRFDAAMAAARADAKPALQVPDHLNAATYLIAADASVPAAGLSQRVINRQMLTILRGANRVASPAEPLARTARFQPYLVWPPTPPNAPAPHAIYSLAQHLASTAIHHQANGRDAETIETLLDLVAIGGMQGAPPPGAIDLDRSIAESMQFANEAIYTIAESLNIARETTATTRPDGPASGAQVRRLIDALLDDSTFEQPYLDRLRATRPLVAQHFTTTRLWRTRTDQVFEPFIWLQAIHYLEMYTQAADHVETSRQHILLQGNTPNRGQRNSLATIVQPVSTQVIQSILQHHYQALADRRVSAIILGMRLYMDDHAGQLPPTLEAMVPTYLPVLPDDPFSATKRSFSYASKPWPALASVGINGIDDGKLKLPRVNDSTMASQSFDPARWSSDDAIYVLPFSPPAKQD